MCTPRFGSVPIVHPKSSVNGSRVVSPLMFFLGEVVNPALQGSCRVHCVAFTTGNGNAILDPFLVILVELETFENPERIALSGFITSIFFHLQGPTSTRGPTACLLHGRGRPKRGGGGEVFWGKRNGHFFVLKETWETWQIKLLDLGGG